MTTPGYRNRGRGAITTAREETGATGPDNRPRRRRRGRCTRPGLPPLGEAAAGVGNADKTTGAVNAPEKAMAAAFSGRFH
jgi:hypothetical protein